MSGKFTTWAFAIVGAELLVLIGVITWAATKDVQAPSTNTKTTNTITQKTPKITPALITTGLAAPTDIASTPDKADARLFVTERAGTIRIVTGQHQLLGTPFLDISGKVRGEGEMGLLGLAFHPKFSQNGFFYINYVTKDQTTVITRYKVSAQTNQADPNSEKILLTVKQPYPNHNGGQVAFGPDGYLYIGLGDGGSAGDPENRAQDKTTILGKMLRIDVNKGDPYAVPADNPFRQTAGAKPEIWATGLRNPWRFSFDGANGDLYIADVGQSVSEELDVQKAKSKGGENYGWRCYEGSKPFNTTQNCLGASQYTAPVLEYDHNEKRCSITGGYVYRGSKQAALAGKYFYGDYCSGQLFYATNQSGIWKQTLAASTPYAISTFGQDSSGELYFADLDNGSVYHLEDSANN
ncbi:MAG TPA: PQQ-dependent sugar dehydrogenase [Nevskiaceae bacterium]|nr:PQQ-dependent sugar dehydrogenase [Nevskiaceae bacterium]